MAQREREEARAVELWAFESAWHARGAQRVAGVDEAGRGPLAGPIVAAAVVFGEQPRLGDLNDSKLLTPEQRERLLPRILETAVDWGIGVVDAPNIDRINIQRANYLAMRLALADLREPPDAVLVDGFTLPEMPVAMERIVKGDRRSWSIAAASVVAKVTRDSVMQHYDARYPQYGFALHKGYGTATHLEALRQHGPSPVHRRSFAPVAEALAGGTRQA